MNQYGEPLTYDAPTEPPVDEAAERFYEYCCHEASKLEVSLPNLESSELTIDALGRPLCEWTYRFTTLGTDYAGDVQAALIRAAHVVGEKSCNVAKAIEHLRDAAAIASGTEDKTLDAVGMTGDLYACRCGAMRANVTMALRALGVETPLTTKQ